MLHEDLFEYVFTNINIIDTAVNLTGFVTLGSRQDESSFIVLPETQCNTNTI